MAITINGNGTVTGISVGGLPNGIVDNDMIANTTIAEGKLAASVNTITQADQWRVNTNFTTSNASGITSNWERNDNTNCFSHIGDGMSESSGVFTFPETGIWKIDWTAMAEATDTQVRYIVADILHTTDNWTTSGQIAFGNNSMSSDNAAKVTSHASALFDVTNVSTHKVKFTVYSEQVILYECSGAANSTYATFIRLGDT